MTTPEKLTALRTCMREHGVDVLLIPSDDYHQSEYVGEYFMSRAYVSGFTGSAGTLVITESDARLFTDGRYYIQAERQLEGSTITLMRSGSEGVPSPTEFVLSILKEGQTLAFDGKCVAAATAARLRKKLPNGAKLRTDIDFPALIWRDRPALPCAGIWKLDEKYHGRAHSDKLSDVRKILGEKGCTALVLSSLCDIAWLYNLRGGDVKNTPVFLAYAIITRDADTLFVQKDAIGALTLDGVTIRDYSEFFEALAELHNETVLVDHSAASEAIVAALSNNKLVDAQNPTVLLKAKKNEVELANLRRCHIADGLAVTRLMLELKYGDRTFDEITVDRFLYSLRREAAERVGVTMIDESFGAICAFGANAAMMHYSASPESAAKIDRNAPVPMLLVDSGGQYLEGPTDITRTFALGTIPEEIKLHYTLTAMGMLRLLNLVFLEGASGKAMDITCREPLWEHGIDYRCGTGHGVGYLLSVHEGPNRFHWRSGDAVIEEGMVTTDEPGVYVEGSHGIRIENELCAVKAMHNEYGQFMKFENLTFCPIDLDAIDRSVMDESDVRRLNAYHKSVYDTLSPYLCANDRGKLAYLTRSIGREGANPS